MESLKEEIYVYTDGVGHQFPVLTKVPLFWHGDAVFLNKGILIYRWSTQYWLSNYVISRPLTVCQTSSYICQRCCCEIRGAQSLPHPVPDEVIH